MLKKNIFNNDIVCNNLEEVSCDNLEINRAFKIIVEVDFCLISVRNVYRSKKLISLNFLFFSTNNFISSRLFLFLFLPYTID